MHKENNFFKNSRIFKSLVHISNYLQSIQFSFSISGSPVGSYSVTWRRVGQPMPSMVSVSSGVLTIPITREEYSGQYYCVVGNNFGYMQELVTLYVLCEWSEAFTHGSNFWPWYPLSIFGWAPVYPKMEFCFYSTIGSLWIQNTIFCTYDTCSMDV